MLDIRLIRAEPERVKAELAKVGVAADQIDAVLDADRARREAIQAVEALRAERTKASNRIRDMKDPAEREKAIAETRALGDRIPAAEQAVAATEEAFTGLMLELPNLPHADVLVGPDDSCNRVVRTEGTAPQFDFTPVPHW